MENGWPLLNLVTAGRKHLEGGNYLRLLLNGKAEELLKAAKRSKEEGDVIAGVPISALPQLS